MKRFFCIAITLLVSSISINAQNFITQWTFPAAATSIRFGALTAGGAVSYTWTASPSGASGSGSFTMTSAGLVTLSASIAAGDVVTLSMAPVNLRRFYMNISPDNVRLTDVAQWGAVPWSSMASALQTCSNVNVSATDIPNLSGVTSMASMFADCTSLTGPANINSWNTSTVTDIRYMFAGATSFNQPIGAWNTGAVIYMHNMFDGLGSTAGFTSFNQDISTWNTASVILMRFMFRKATSFNQPIGVWNTGAVTEMSEMFSGAAAFNQPIGGWNTAVVTSMTSMFSNASSFNQNIGNWKLNSGVSMANLFTNSGMDCNNYSATLKGWYNGNPTVTGRSLGAAGMKYTVAVGAAERSSLVLATGSGGRGWTITGDGLVTAAVPYLVPITTSITGVEACDAPYLNPANKSQKLLQIDANGNSFNHATATVTVNNSSTGYDAGGLIGYNINAGLGTGYSQMANGTNTLRVGHRLHSIQQTGTYAANGGVKVRVYYNPNDISTITGNPTTGNPITTHGWFKSIRHSAMEVFQDMNYSTMTLNNAVAISPIASGVEGGVNYAEFLLESFSTIGYYAGTQLKVLPVTLTRFDVRTQDCIVKLNWQTAEEINFSRFEIERSNDGINYSTISTVVANGDNSSYNYTDNSAKEGKNIYRLKMTDNDGKYKYSSLKLVMVNCHGNKSVVIYPNPASENINISLSGYTKPLSGKLFNNIGQLVKATLLVNGTNTIPANGLSKGVYNLVIMDEAGKNTCYKVIVN